MAPVVTFFNNKGGVGKTSLVYHLAWMFRELGIRVLAVDLDPQANLTAAFVEERRLEELWPDGAHPETLYGVLEPLSKGVGDIAVPPHLERLGGIDLLPGDLALARFEDELSSQWPACLDRKERAFRVVTAFWRAIQSAAATTECDLVLVDVGPNLGAINRAALVASDHVVVPLTPDLFSLQGLRNLGPTLRDWRGEWQERRDRRPEDLAIEIPAGAMQPLGYVVLQHAVRLNRPVKAYDLWMRRIPTGFRSWVLGEDVEDVPDAGSDPWCLGRIKHYHSLIPMGQEARKPLFLLRAADGAIGAHQQSVQSAYADFRRLAEAVAKRVADEPASAG